MEWPCVAAFITIVSSLRRSEITPQRRRSRGQRRRRRGVETPEESEGSLVRRRGPRSRASGSNLLLKNRQKSIERRRPLKKSLRPRNAPRADFTAVVLGDEFQRRKKNVSIARA